MLELLASHTAVVYQPPFNSRYYSGLNPYTLGFAIFTDLRRLCEQPTDEDREWFPDIAGSDWQETLHFAMKNFKDESFIQQFLSPKVMRDLKLFAIENDDEEDAYLVTAIHDEIGYRTLREKLARQYNLSSREPDIQVWNVDLRGDRSLTLQHIVNDRRPLAEDSEEVLRHIHRLWGFDVHLQSVSDGTVVEEYQCPATTPSV
jgi:spore cortex formation protein SpoVR/YcgB (stage V sporulation)